MPTNLDAAKKAARRLQQALKDVGVNARLSLCQEAIARGCGRNDWHHLQKTAGAGNLRPASPAPLANAIAESWPSAVVDAEAVARMVLRVGTGEVNSEEAVALRREWAGKAVSEGFTRALDAFHVCRREQAALDCGILPDDPRFALFLHVGTHEETKGSGMRIREAEAWLCLGEDPVGFASGTLYDVEQPGGVPDRVAADAADIVSDEDVWTVFNLAREHPKIFARSVLYLASWELRTDQRGKGIGTSFLGATVAALKRRYRRLATIAADSSFVHVMPSYDGPRADAVLQSCRERMEELLSAPAVIRPLGPRGRVALFSNARRGSPIQTMIAMGGIWVDESPEREIDQDIDLGDEAGAVRLFAEGQRRLWQIAGMTASGGAPAAPSPLKHGEFPERWTPLSIALGLPLNPHPKFHLHMPRELVRIDVAYSPPDLMLSDHALASRPNVFIYRFRNGTDLAINAESFPDMDVNEEAIKEENRRQPYSPYAPSIGQGTLMGVLLSNTRLLFGHPDKGSEGWRKVPITVRADMNPPRVAASCIDWPDDSSWPDVQTAFDSALTAAELRLAAEMRTLASAALKEGFMEREAYQDTWDGQTVIRQRFHQRPWPDGITTRTFSGISVEISPTMPHADEGCSAHETYGGRLRDVVVRHCVGAIRRRCEESPDLLPAQALGPGDGSLDHRLRHLTYYGSFWWWWLDAVTRRIDEYEGVPLGDLAG